MDRIIKTGIEMFVIFDAEPWGGDNSKPAEIGITFMALSNMCEISPGSAIPVTLDEAVLRYKLESHCLSITENKRTSTSIERHRFGCQRSIKADQIESHIMHLVRVYRERHYAEQVDAPCIFTGFDLVYELRLLSTLYGQLTTSFDSWLDTQELAAATSGTKRPGLSDTLQACGFGSRNVKDLQSRQGQHNAATDTVRAAAVLVHLMRLAEAGDEKLVISQPLACTPATESGRTNRPLEFAHEKRAWDGLRPRPKELYPYAARVKRTTCKPSTAQELLDIFDEYKPVAAGSRKNRPYGWLCLESLDTLDDFVRRMDGAEAGGNDGGVWSVVSDYDASIVPARSMAELNQRLLQEADGKREERRLKRLPVREGGGSGHGLCDLTEALT